ncbi:MAG: response regulator [Gallionella sp.]|jgi:PAS domain S-box-containing protein
MTRRQLIYAVLIPLLALVVQWLLWPYLTPYVWFVFFPAVFISARLSGVRGGLLSTILSVLLVWYFFMTPQFAWVKNNTAYLYSVGLFLLMGYLFSTFQARLARAVSQAEEAAQQALEAERQIVELTEQARLRDVELLADAQQRQESLYHTTLNALLESVIVFSPQGEVMACNRAAKQFFGLSLSEMQSRLRPSEVHLLRADGTDCPIEELPVTRTIATGIACRDVTLAYVAPDGAVVWTQASSEPVNDPVSGQLNAVVLSITDVSKRKRAEDEQTRLNRALRAYSASDWALIHAEDEVAYMTEVCRIIVDQCGHIMAWVGLAEDDEAKSVRPVAHAGFEAGYLDMLQLSWSDSERGRGPTGTAIRTGKAKICNHMLTDPVFLPWREQALQRGYAASIGLPLLIDGRAFGALMIYSRQPSPFVEEEVKVLQELADDLAYGINMLRIRRAHASQEVALRGSEERYRLLVDQSVDGIFVADAQGNYIDVNISGAQMLGYSREELLKHSIADVILPSEIERIGVEVARFAGGDVVVSEWHFLRKDGSVFLGEVSGRQMPDGSLQGVLRDVTVRRLHETQLREAQLAALNLAQDAVAARAKAEQANEYLELEITQRMQMLQELDRAFIAADAANRAKSDFLANMSHEIRTPMNAIMGLTQLTLDGELTVKQRSHLGKVQTASRALLSILDDILDYSKIEAGRMELERVGFRVEDVVRTAGDLFSANLAGKNLELFLELDCSLRNELLGDPLRLGQVLNNLLSNAIKFTGAGEIHIKVEQLAQDEQGVWLRFSVRDTGIGMDDEQIGNLFGAFSQADTSITRKYGGTGLGLAISKRLVEMMGGEFSLSSVPGQGSTFAFTARFGAGHAVHLQPELRGMRVLIVDDQATASSILKNYLTAWRFDVTLVLSAEAAWDSMEEAQLRGHPFELLISDRKMPGMGGMELLHRMEAAGGHRIPLILMVGAHHQEPLLHETGVVLLVKPVTPSDLFDALMHIQNPDKVMSAPLQDQQLDLYHLAESIRGAHVLLAEDNEINQEVASEFLRNAGLRITLANDGAEAVEQVKNTRFDAVLMDLQMPVMDGFTAAHLIRSMPEGKDIPIIALSAAVMMHDKQASEQAGMNDHIAKPFDPVQLIKTLLKWIKPQSGPSADRPVVVESVCTDIPGFDLPTALSRLGGNWAMLSRLLLKFAEEQAGCAAKVNELLIEKQGDKAVGLLHRFRGSASTLGAVRLAEVAQRFENEIKSGSTLATQTLFEQTLFEAVQLINQHIAAANALPVPPRCDKARVESDLSTLAACLNNNELLPEAQIAGLLSALSACVPAQLLAELDRHIQNFDFDAGSGTLARIVAFWKEKSL